MYRFSISSGRVRDGISIEDGLGVRRRVVVAINLTQVEAVDPTFPVERLHGASLIGTFGLLDQSIVLRLRGVPVLNVCLVECFARSRSLKSRFWFFLAEGPIDTNVSVVERGHSHRMIICFILLRFRSCSSSIVSIFWRVRILIDQERRRVTLRNFGHLSRCATSVFLLIQKPSSAASNKVPVLGALRWDDRRQFHFG